MGAHAGALVVGDARLLALPVRSFKGTFAFVTSPLLLRLAKRDLGVEATSFQMPPPMAAGSFFATSDTCVNNGKVYLQDLDLNARVEAGNGTVPAAWANYIAPKVFGTGDDDYFTNRFMIVDDETMTFLCETATQIDQRIRINEGTRTVDKGALWIEKSLPPETLLIGLMEADRGRKSGFDLNSDCVMNFALPNQSILQFGGKATVGRGRCSIIPISRAPAGGT